MKKNYFVFSSGTLKRKDNTVALEKLDGKKKHIPVEKIESLYLFGEITFNTRLLSFLTQKQVLVHMFNRNGWYIGSFGPRKKKISGKLKINQVKAYLNKKRRLGLALLFIDGAMYNMIRLLQRNKENIEKPDITDLKDLKEQLPTAKNVNQLMAIEGTFRQFYYPLLAEITSQEFTGRKKRPPVGKLNSLISFGNTLLYTTTLNKIYQTQLDPTVSYLHEPCEMRFSLSLDIAEIFKPIIVDRLIISLFNKKQIDEKDFDEDFNSTLLNESGRTKFITAYEDFLKNTIFYPKLKRKTSYGSLIRFECYKLIKSLIETEDYKPLHMWW